MHAGCVENTNWLRLPNDTVMEMTMITTTIMAMITITFIMTDQTMPSMAMVIICMAVTITMLSQLNTIALFCSPFFLTWVSSRSSSVTD